MSIRDVGARDGVQNDTCPLTLKMGEGNYVFSPPPTKKRGQKLRKAELLAWVCFEATQLFCCQLSCPSPKTFLHHISHEHHTCPLPRPHFFVQFNFCLLPHILHFFLRRKISLFLHCFFIIVDLSSNVLLNLL